MGSSRNRTAGHTWERTIARKFREIGFTHCKTSREASKLLDNCKVDHWGIPYNIQAKNGYNKGLNYQEILNQIQELLGKDYPQRLEYPTVILHKKKTSHLAIMDMKDFYNLISKLAMYEGTETKYI